MALTVIILLALFGVLALFRGVTKKETLLGKLLILLGAISIVGGATFSYVTWQDSVNQITSAAAQLNLTIQYVDNKFKGISVIQDEERVTVEFTGNQAVTETLPSAKSGVIKDMPLGFGNNKALTLVISSRNINERTVGENSVNIDAQLDNLAHAEVSQINGGVEDLQQTQWIEFSVPDPLAGSTFTVGGITQRGNTTSTVIVNGTIDLIVNGNKKAKLQIVNQSALPDSNSVITIPIKASLFSSS